MKPLLWKEMRDLRPFLAIAGAMLLALALLLCFNRRFEESFLGAYVLGVPLFTLLAAIGLGAMAMARERASKTLDYLLARPIAPSAIVWIKFLSGSVALALTVLAMAALCYIDPEFHRDETALVFRQGIAFSHLFLMLFPRAWCVYAFSLLCSVVVDRVAKGVMLTGVSALAAGILAGMYLDLAPFSDAAAWLPVLDPSVLIRLECDPGLIGLTAFTLSAAAILLALAAARLFQWSPARILSDRALAVGMTALIAMAILSNWIEPNRLPVLAPAGTMELGMNAKYQIVAMGASGRMLSVAAPDSLAFVDFADPAKPRKAAEASMPLWTTKNLAVSGAETYILGTKKALPLDERQIAIASLSPQGSVQFAEPISLGAEDTLDFTGSAAVAGHYLFVDTIRQRQCRIEVYDLSPGASRRAPAATLTVDTVRAQPPGTPEREIRKGTMRMVLHGQFLYVTSPSALTAIDIRDPGRPVAASRTAFHDFIPLIYGVQRELASDGRWLLESELWLPQNLYDLADPAHPALRGHVPPVEYSGVVGTGPSLFQGWRRGVLEFRAANGGLQARRYLTDGRKGVAYIVTAADGYVYTLKRVEERRYVSAYRVNP
jgi:ABC-type transport system involved in multi-copper enzyme maturation permease subunit